MSGTPGPAGPFACLALFALLLPALAAAQAPRAADERVRLIATERADSSLSLPQPRARPRETGGWTSLTFLDLSDDDHDRRTPDLLESLILTDLRLWTTAQLGRDVSVYGRLRLQEFEFSSAPFVVVPDTRRQERLDVDLAYVDWLEREGPWHARVGRQFVRVGRGLTLALDLDAASLEHAVPGRAWRVTAGQTVLRDPNVDSSVVGFDRGTQKRNFYVAEGEHRTRAGTQYYLYVVAQEDRSRSLSAVQAARDFRSRTVHTGAGTAGQFRPVLHYYLELVLGGGGVLADLPGDPRVSLDARGLSGGLLYYADLAWTPLATLELAHGSGDPTRASVTGAFGGKLAATSDRNFLYFGSYDAGLALSPRLSNLTALRLGYQVKPLPRDGDELPELLAGGKLSYYVKDETNGVISDPVAVRASSDIGWGLDIFAGYRPLSDLSLLVQYGAFFPGSAYAPGADDASDRLLVTSTLSF